jgi:hypothetical protein
MRADRLMPLLIRPCPATLSTPAARELQEGPMGHVWLAATPQSIDQPGSEEMGRGRSAQVLLLIAGGIVASGKDQMSAAATARSTIESC